MSSLSELYQNVILEHNRSPRNYRVMEDADRQAEGNNPLCGDQLTVWLKLDGDVISDVSFQGLGLRHLPGVGVADDRGGEGQVACEEAEAAVRAIPPTGHRHDRRRPIRKPWGSSPCSPEYRRIRRG